MPGSLFYRLFKLALLGDIDLFGWHIQFGDAFCVCYLIYQEALMASTTSVDVFILYFEVLPYLLTIFTRKDEYRIFWPLSLEFLSSLLFVDLLGGLCL